MGEYFDALVIGGGFYGCEVALAMRRAGARRVAVIEAEKRLLRRASYVNQARIHNGYHYPRSLLTGQSSRRNFARFCDEYRFAVHASMTKLYAIARGSMVDPSQFERFCRDIGAPYRALGAARARLFDTSLIEEAYEVRELAFDAEALAQHLAEQLSNAGVHVRTSTRARVVGSDANWVEIALGDEVVRAGYLFNCSYANLDAVGIPIAARIKKELAEIALIEPPRDLVGVGVTVMDGPFFSSMPFPALRCHSLTHVRYTPHEAWTTANGTEFAPVKSNAAYMLRDSARFMPCLQQATYLRSIFDLKAVLVSAEASDGRPILFERHEAWPRVISILGAKVDNIYDIVEFIGSQRWEF